MFMLNNHEHGRKMMLITPKIQRKFDYKEKKVFFEQPQ